MDFKTLGENLGLELEEFVELVELFASSAASDIDRLSKAYENSDTKQVSEAAHSLKGSSGNLGFGSFSEIAKKVEEKAKNGNIEGSTETISLLNEKLQEITEQLKNHSR